MLDTTLTIVLYWGTRGATIIIVFGFLDRVL